MKRMLFGRKGQATTAVIGVAAIASLLILGAALVIHQDQASSSNLSYGNNGLSCSFPAGTASSMEYLVPKIVNDSRFLNLAGGNPYVYDGAINTTNNFAIIGGTYQGGALIGGTTENLPNLVEMEFYTWGPNTSCGDTNLDTAQGGIVVQVPIENGSFNITGASFHPATPGAQ